MNTSTQGQQCVACGRVGAWPAVNVHIAYVTMVM